MTRYTITCNRGEHPLHPGADLGDAIDLGRRFAVRNGWSVLVVATDDDGTETDVAFIPPALQTEDVPLVVFGVVPVPPGLAARN